MMMPRFVIVDDDISICKIVKNIIDQYKLGQVIAECGNGLEAENILSECQIDIAFVDVLLPGQDGIQLVRKIRAVNPDISFIMLSQVSNQTMITKAYESGIEFFIHKPVNVLEVVSMINKVYETRKLKHLMNVICQTTAQYTVPLAASTDTAENKLKMRIYKVFSELGIIGEAGAKDIYKLTQMINTVSVEGKEKTYQLSENYQKLSQKLGQDSKTIEQRVRRTITKALHNLASLGVEDYYNEKFQVYSTALFDFKEVRLTMDFINGKSPYHGKINVKKFLEGLLYIANAEG